MPIKSPAPPIAAPPVSIICAAAVSAITTPGTATARAAAASILALHFIICELPRKLPTPGSWARHVPSLPQRALPVGRPLSCSGTRPTGFECQGGAGLFSGPKGGRRSDAAEDRRPGPPSLVALMTKPTCQRALVRISLKGVIAVGKPPTRLSR